MSALTLVTVVFEAEVPLLALQARSMQRFVDDTDFAKIIVIDNTRRGLSRRSRRHLLAQYGSWGPKVAFLRPADICDLPTSTGWVSQQVLKLMVHAHVHTPFYLVLDAKNHWLRDTTPETFVNPDGRARGASHPYRGHALEAKLTHVLEYLGVDAGSWIDNFPVTHTPVVLSTELVRRMTIEIAERSERPFAEEFVQSGLIEFFLYSGWLIATFGRFDGHIDGTVVRSANVWPGQSSNSEFRRVLADADRRQAPFLSVHRTALARADRSAARSLAGFWQEHDLFADRRRGLAFIAAFKCRYVWAMSLRKVRKVIAARRG